MEFSVFRKNTQDFRAGIFRPDFSMERYGFPLDISNADTMDLPTARPVDQAAWRLNPPVTPSMFNTSPAKYSPGDTLDSSVSASSSEQSTPPAVTNSSPALRAVRCSSIPSPNALASALRSSLESVAPFWLRIRSGSTPAVQSASTKRRGRFSKRFLTSRLLWVRASFSR